MLKVVNFVIMYIQIHTMIFYLTKEEQKQSEKLIVALGEKLAEEVQIEEEKGTMYESEEELKHRFELGCKEPHPELAAFGKAKSFEDIELQHLPPEAVTTLLYYIGATGISGLIAVSLQKLKTADHLVGLSALSFARHVLLESNSLFSYEKQKR